MRIIKFSFETAEQAKRDTQPTNHGMSRRVQRSLTKETSMSFRHDDIDVQITGEGPGKYQRRP